MSGNGEVKTPPITAWVKVVARADGSIGVENSNVDMENPRNLAAILDLLAAGVSAICHTRLAKMGEQSRIVPAVGMPKVAVMRKRGT